MTHTSPRFLAALGMTFFMGTTACGAVGAQSTALDDTADAASNQALLAQEEQVVDLDTFLAHPGTQHSMQAAATPGSPCSLLLKDATLLIKDLGPLVAQGSASVANIPAMVAAVPAVLATLTDLMACVKVAQASTNTDPSTPTTPAAPAVPAFSHAFHKCTTVILNNQQASSCRQ